MWITFCVDKKCCVSPDIHHGNDQEFFLCSAIPAILPDGDKCWRGAFCTMAMWAVNKSDHDNKDVNKEVNKYVTKDINEYDNEDDKRDVNGDKKDFVIKFC